MLSIRPMKKAPARPSGRRGDKHRLLVIGKKQIPRADYSKVFK